MTPTILSLVTSYLQLLDDGDAQVVMRDLEARKVNFASGGATLPDHYPVMEVRSAPKITIDFSLASVVIEFPLVYSPQDDEVMKVVFTVRESLSGPTVSVFFE